MLGCWQIGNLKLFYFKNCYNKALGRWRMLRIYFSDECYQKNELLLWYFLVKIATLAFRAGIHEIINKTFWSSRKFFFDIQSFGKYIYWFFYSRYCFQSLNLVLKVIIVLIDDDLKNMIWSVHLLWLINNKFASNLNTRI